MRISYKNAIAGFAVSILSAIGASAVSAQEVIITPAPAAARTGAPLEYRNSVNEEFNDAYFDHDHDYFTNRKFTRQVDWLIGIGGFPENEITYDGKEVHELYREVLARQMASGPIIRVFDLPTPFCQSLRTLPSSPNCLINGCPSVGCSAAAQPVAPAPVVPPIIERAPTELPPRRQVPALW
jgi:hypothetical protein